MESISLKLPEDLLETSDPLRQGARRSARRTDGAHLAQTAPRKHLREHRVCKNRARSRCLSGLRSSSLILIRVTALSRQDAASADRPGASANQCRPSPDADHSIDDLLCILVIIGVRADAEKELLVVEDGYRASVES